MTNKEYITLYKDKLYRGTHLKKVSFNISWQDVIILLMLFFIQRVLIVERLMPFGIAFLAVIFIFYRRDLFFNAVAVAGILTVYFNIEAIKYILAIGILYALFPLLVEREHSKIDEQKVITRASITTLLAVIISNLIFNAFTDLTLYNTIIMLSEAFISFLFVFIFSNIRNVLFIFSRKRILSSEEIISLGIFVALAVEGFFNITIWDISLKNVLSLFIVLCLGYIWGAGIGSSLGITIGIVMSFSGNMLPYAIANLGFCGLLAGIFNQLGRMGSISGFVLGNAILTYYINGSSSVIIPFKEILTASVILLILPRRIIELLKEYTGFYKLRIQKDYIGKIKEFLNRRLLEFADVFRELSQTLYDAKRDCNGIRQEDIAGIFDAAAGKICRYCSLNHLCWEKDFYNTYQYLFKLVSTIDEKGWISDADIPPSLRKKCPHVDEMKRLLEGLTEYYRYNYKWQQKINESRRLVFEQLAGMAKVIRGLASDINVNIDFDNTIEDVLLVALDERGIRAKNIIVARGVDGKLEIEIVRDRCNDIRSCLRNVQQIISKTLKANFIARAVGCSDTNQSECVIRLMEAERYNIVTGVARRMRQNCVICGDSYTFMPLKNGRYVMAVSDGMGSGEEAASESTAAVSLLEQMLEADFDQTLIVKTINSVLMLRSSTEMFATMDMCLLDMIEGIAEFVKIGACPSFIKSGDRVEVIRSSSLPIGIMADVAFESMKRKVKAGDFIILLTDGILDANPNVEDKEKWLCELIGSINTANPQEMAEQIASAAVYAAGTDYPADDMTVIVSRLWENI